MGILELGTTVPRLSNYGCGENLKFNNLLIKTFNNTQLIVRKDNS